MTIINISNNNNTLETNEEIVIIDSEIKKSTVT